MSESDQQRATRELQDEYDRLNALFGLDQLAQYDARQAELFRKVVLRIRDALKAHGGHAADLDGLVEIVASLSARSEIGPRK